MERVILHLDMDAFFAAVEQRERVELRGEPVLVGRRGPRGVVATCSYEARRFGVRSAMPSVTAERRCPRGIWVAPRLALYRAVSQRIVELVRSVAPIVAQTSVDEVCADLTGIAPDLRAGAALARRLKRQIRQTEALTASAGLSYCRFVAKIASDLEKPDGLVVLDREQFSWRVGPLSVRVLPGVGPKLAARLQRLGIDTVAALAHCPESGLRQELGPALARCLKERAAGEDDAPIAIGVNCKQISEERTYGADLVDPDQIERELLRRCEDVAAALRDKGVLARTVVLKVRDGAYDTATRSHTLPEPIDLAGELFEAVARLLRERVDLRGRGVRLLGVAAKDLVRARDVAPSLFPDQQRERARRMTRAADQLRRRFGADAVRLARLIDHPLGREAE